MSGGSTAEVLDMLITHRIHLGRQAADFVAALQAETLAEVASAHRARHHQKLTDRPKQRVVGDSRGK